MLKEPPCDIMWIDAVEVFPYRGQLTLYLGESGKSLVWMGTALGKFMAEPQRHSSKQWGAPFLVRSWFCWKQGWILS